MARGIKTVRAERPSNEEEKHESIQTTKFKLSGMIRTREYRNKTNKIGQDRWNQTPH